MTIYPAIDLYEGQVVRLTRGDFSQKTVYSDDPGAMAKKWADDGASWIHVVDLEGAKTGNLTNNRALLEIRKTVKCKIQFGGGLRSIETIQSVLAQGIDRVVVGTKALDEKFLQQAVSLFGDKLAIGLDTKDGYLQTAGWLEQGIRLDEALIKLNEYRVSTVIYTDIQKDGMLKGPNFEGLESVLSNFSGRVILSGGVGSLEDIRQCSKLKQANFEGVIIGKALYDKKFALKEALNLRA